jgi:hypothetical protein
MDGFAADKKRAESTVLRPMIREATVDFPLPDSPTIPTNPFSGT